MLGVVVVVAFIAWRFVARTDQASQGATAPPATVGTDSGQAVVIVDSAALVRAGIATAVPERISYSPTLAAYGRVLDVGALAAARTTLSAAQAAVARTAAVADAAERELARVQMLAADSGNASAKALDEATAAARGATADADAARTAERAQEAAVIQEWGPVVGRWTADGGEPLARLLTRRDALLLVSLSADTVIAVPPAHVTILTGGGSANATFVSLGTQTDVRTQGQTYFYVVRAGPTLPAGLNVAVALPVGATEPGFDVPRSAVVWAEGGAWIYIQTGATTFVRRAIVIDAPVSGGYVVRDLPPTTRVVVRGAQFLLSEEHRAHAPPSATVDPDG
ncbi:MAG TPA: hypothetical protein VMV51_10750 [Gemmatimonadaceae bacterium]|nr:hypothetical protein [Gemmatimonadaceae bacterium]